jgi:surfeit locus 1 family protein
MHFRPSIQLSLILITLAAVFLRLAIWQLDRKAEKTELFERFATAPSLGIEAALSGGRDMARVDAFGHYDPVRHVLLDNKIWEGRAGVHVLTPFQLADGRWLLVNRGWLPLPPDRSALPEVPTGSGERTIHGRLMAPDATGLRLGSADELVPDRWPQLATYFDPDRIGEALGLTLQPWILWLDAEDGSGFQGRQWTPAVMTPEVHGAYAVQWLALCATALVIWIALGLRRGALFARRSDSEKSSKIANGRP